MIKILAGIAYEQNRPTGLASAMNVQYVLYKNIFQIKVVTNYNTQLLMQKVV